MKPNSCESCLMPFDKDLGERESARYCSLCFKNGELCYKGNDLKEFQGICYRKMRENGMGFIRAKLYTWSIRFAPRWQKSSSNA